MMPAPSAHRILLLMDHSLDFVELLGSKGVIQGVSSAIKPLGGYDPQDLLGNHYQDIIHPDDWARAAKAFSRALHGDKSEPITLRYICKDGSWRTIRASARSFLEDPAVKAVVVLTRDITDQIEAEESLAQANRELRKLTQQLMSIHETERNHLAAELHDDVQQILVGLRMSMEPALGRGGANTSADMIKMWIDLTQEALDHLHNLTTSLRTPVLGNRGLQTELRAYIDRTSAAIGHVIEHDIDADLGPLSPEIALACFRIIQEALTNAIKHAGARHLKICVHRSAGNLVVSIRDRGPGFNVAEARNLAAQTGCVGLLSMRERATSVGGSLEIKSGAGSGTRVRATFHPDEYAEAHKLRASA